MSRHFTRFAICVTVVLICAVRFASAAVEDDAKPAVPTARQLLGKAVARWADLLEPKEGATPRTLTARFKVIKAKGLPNEVANLSAEFAYQAPDKLRVAASVPKMAATMARDGQTLWVDEPSLNFAVLGKSGVARFKGEPNDIDHTVLPPFKLPVSRMKLAMLMLALDVEQAAPEKIGDETCDVLKVSLGSAASDILEAGNGRVTLWLRPSDSLPLRIAYQDGDKADVQVDVLDPKLEEPWDAKRWQLEPREGTHVETVAVSHLVRFLEIAPRLLTEKAPALAAAEGERTLVATEGNGRLERIDGTRVLFLKGSAQEMGRQQGKLLGPEVHQICDHILYGVGVASSFAKGKWFFDEIEGAQARLGPFMDKNYMAEMDAMADAAHIDRYEGRLANFFPELFHCSGFSLFGKATADGHMFHGRVLDYLKGVGLEQNAVVMVYQPDYGNAWVNLGYAGFIGTVTAMNEKQISIGEMGGGGYGAWDGKPMAELMREVMEKANTLDDAVRIMHDSPRTCNYYYVISDGKSKQAVGIAATPTQFVVIHPGEKFPQLPHPFQDAVLMSAGSRYEALAERVKNGYGSFTADSARELMTRPVCMTSNIQAVLFEPDTLDFWVANADAHHVAAAARYTHYNLKALLASKPPKPAFEF